MKIYDFSVTEIPVSNFRIHLGLTGKVASNNIINGTWSSENWMFHKPYLMEDYNETL